MSNAELVLRPSGEQPQREPEDRRSVSENFSAYINSLSSDASVKLLAVRENIAVLAAEKAKQASAVIEFVKEHPQEFATATVKNVGKNVLTWGTVGFAVRTGVSFVGGALEVFGKPISVATAVVVKGIRETYDEWKSFGSKKSREYFHDHVGHNVFDREEQSTFSKVVHAVERGAVDAGVRKAFNVEGHKRDAIKWNTLIGKDGAETLANMRADRSDFSYADLLGAMREAKLAIDTSVNINDRTHARIAMKGLYAAALAYGAEIGDTSGKVWNKESKDRFVGMRNNVNQTMDDYASTGWKLAGLGRALHAAPLAAVSSLLGAHLFEQYVSHTAWYQGIQNYVKNIFASDTVVKPATVVHSDSYAQAYAKQPIIAEHKVTPVWHAAQHDTSNSDISSSSSSGLGDSKPPRPNGTVDVGVVPFKIETESVVFDQMVPSEIKVKSGDGIFQSLVDCGYKVTHDGSGKQFVQCIAPVFIKDQAVLVELQNIVIEHPEISADDLRKAAIANGVNFDGNFVMQEGTYQIPNVVVPEPDTYTEAMANVKRSVRNGIRLPAEDEVVVPVKPIVAVDAADTLPRMQMPTEINFKSADVTVVDTQTKMTMPQTLTFAAPVNEGSIDTTSSMKMTMPIEFKQPDADLGNPGVTVDEVAPTTQVETPVMVMPDDVVAAEFPVSNQTVPETGWAQFYEDYNYNETKAFGFDWSQENAKNISITSNPFVFDGKTYKLFRYEDIGLKNREWNQQLQIDMKGKLTTDWIQYDARKNNLVIWVHASGNTHAETARALIEGVEDQKVSYAFEDRGNPDHLMIPPYGEAQVYDRMSRIPQSEASITLNQFGRSVEFDLTGITRWEHQDLDAKSVHYGNYFNFFDELPGRDKVYVVFCGAYYSEAMKVLSGLNIVDPNAADYISDPAIQAEILKLQNASVQGDEYRQAVERIMGYLSTHGQQDIVDRFSSELTSPHRDYSRLSYTRYVMEFTPEN